MSSFRTDRDFTHSSRPTNPHLPVAGQSRTPHGNVRRRGRDRYQARIYVGGRAGGAVHLGMYESETAAEQVARRVLRSLLASAGGTGTATLTPIDVWKATQRLAANGFDIGGQLASLLPRWVCVDPAGRGYGVRVSGGNGCDRGGFATVEEAYAEACRLRKLSAERRKWRSGVLVQMSILRDMDDVSTFGVIVCGAKDELSTAGATDAERTQDALHTSSAFITSDAQNTQNSERTTSIQVKRVKRSTVNPAQRLFDFGDGSERAEGGEVSDGGKSHTASFGGGSGSERVIAA